MRRKFVKTSAILLAFIMIASILSTIIPLLIHAEDRAYDTSTPNFIYDFTTEEIYSSLAGNYNLSITLKDGYTTFEALGNDPQTGLIAPSCKPSEAKYALISYYTTATYKGEFFCTRSDNSTMGTSGTHQQWNWNASGNWETILVSLDAWSNADENVTFKNFRFDPLQDNVNVKTGSTIDIKFIAFFTTESDAKNFNFDEYKTKLAYEEEQKRAEEESAKEVDWPDPTYTEMTTTAEDTNSGTLKYKTSVDGSTVTISYEVNGETLSYTVPNNNNYLFGGYAGTDDLNRPLYDSSEVGSYEAGKREIGLFYFLWHGEHGDSGVFDLQKIIDEVGIDAADNDARDHAGLGAGYCVQEVS